MLLPDLSMLGGPYASVLDVGGNIGDFAKAAYLRWPGARITSFEPLADVANYNRVRGQDRWHVETVGLGRDRARLPINRNVNASAVSTLLRPGHARADLGLTDEWAPGTIDIVPLDDYLERIVRPCLLKIDVEGYELAVLKGADAVLRQVDTVVIEVQNDPDIFVGAPTVRDLSVVLDCYDLRLTRIAGAYTNPDTEALLQYDGVWTR